MAYGIYDIGYDSTLSRSSNATGDLPNLPDLTQLPATGTYTGGLTNNLVEGSISPATLSSGAMAQLLYSGKQTFTDTTAGYRMGVDSDGIYKWIIGDAASSADWAVTTAATLTIKGAITATTGTIGGFSIGSDYIRDTANSFGLASTVTGGDDVRFWAGDTFANRATAPTRITEAGVLTATGVNITGSLFTVNGAVLDVSSFYGNGSDGAFSSSSGTTALNTAGKNVYQYSSFSLTGTAKFTFGSNLQNLPIFILVNGDMTVTSSDAAAIDGKGLGGQAGTGGAAATGPTNAGTAGTSGATAMTDNKGNFSTADSVANHGGASGGGGGGYGNAGVVGVHTHAGTPGAGGVSWSFYTTMFPILRQVTNAFIGGGGAGGNGATNGGEGTGGAGGKGGACVIFLVKGAINLTSAMTIAGNVGTAGTNGASYGGGGGGGGGGGFLGIFYFGTATANSTVITSTGGAGGAGGSGGSEAGQTGGNGGAGQGLIKQITSGLGV